ncbi:MAG: hypothetical protein EAZ90_26815 [Oscillatoriales cyanobacterium]|nr:MAG: hypothetical protein EAZ94_26815 [Oscillatoriales cyanobacterium]TAE19209.1 MAG: hypothetical protein EAZ93_27620 [Oscillatoriales cyanobacterium]TAE37392.1 MAG: hypothetical protein EAZ90_26815 [Oscillatoriales cyanobacterium]TAH17895.1 MAG: hypothetical protein EAZ10_17485 [Oscillatoriales cyanobacterium]
MRIEDGESKTANRRRRIEDGESKTANRRRRIEDGESNSRLHRQNPPPRVEEKDRTANGIMLFSSVGVRLTSFV